MAGRVPYPSFPKGTLMHATRIVVLAVLTAATVVGLTPSARADAGVRIGALACEAVPGTRLNLLIMSSVDVKCVFNGLNGRETYKGETGIALGADLNLKGVERISFAVLAATSAYQVGSYALAGRYVGAKASASVGVGAWSKPLMCRGG